MDKSELLQENIKNKIKYELYLSKQPNEQLMNDYKKHVSSLIKQNDAATTTTTSNKDLFPLKRYSHRNILYGYVRFDQNIEEEWLIIYLLFELSKHDSDLVIKVHDNDGDILLIEAAEHLPQWLESSKSKNRVFIHKGHLHIIPENINLKELHSNYKSFSCSPTSSSSSSPSVSVTQVAAQFIREMNRPSTSNAAALNNYSCTSASINGDSSSGSNGGGQHNRNYSENCRKKVDTLAGSNIQRAIREQLAGMPDKNVWLSKKFKQLDDIISDKTSDEAQNLNKKFRESLSLASVMAMNDEDLRISPISSAPSSISSSLSSSSSSSWMSEQQND